MQANALSKRGMNNSMFFRSYRYSHAPVALDVGICGIKTTWLTA